MSDFDVFLPARLEALAALRTPSAVFWIVTTWLTWWGWRFMLRPLLHPEEPRELPYLIPVLGHAIAFFRNGTELIERASEWVGGSRDPFSLTIAGDLLYVIPQPKDVTEAYRNTSTFSFDVFVRDLMRWHGISERAIDAMFRSAPDTIFANPKARSLGNLARDMHNHQLLPGKNLDLLDAKFYACFSAYLHTDRLLEMGPKYHRSKEEGEIVMPLDHWVSHLFVRAGTETYFGEQMLQLDPDLVDVFLEYDNLSWQVLYQYPRVLARRMYAAQDRLMACMKRYFDMPQEQRRGDAWFTKAMENEMLRLGIESRDIARMMTMIHWAINTNTRRACFWMLCYMLQDPALLEEIRAETGKVWRSNAPGGHSEPELDLTRLLESCPRLDAAWNETLRLTAFSASVRFVSEDTRLGGKLLRKGNRLLIPKRQLLQDEAVFGPRPMVFDSDRFYRNDRLLRSPNWRPYGGGTTMCPGRFIAKRAAFSLVAVLLARFDICKADPSQPLPTQATGIPVLGIVMSPPGTEFSVRLRERKLQRN